LKTDGLIDDSAVIVLHEAHLVTRSLHQSDLLRFGSGRLLEDLIKFIFKEGCNRKLILIGDPYSLTYGKEEDSSLNLETLKELFNGTIKHFRHPVQTIEEAGKLKLRTCLALSIEEKKFNNLSYGWNNNDLVQIDKTDAFDLLKGWFSLPLVTEPDKSVLYYSN